MKYSTLLVILLLSGLLAACSGTDEPQSASELTVTLAESGETHVLKDDLRLLADVRQLRPLGEGRMLIADSSPSLSLFEDHEMIRVLGGEGEGPCEYTSISAMDVTGDTAHVLSIRQAKVISYSLSTGECLGETSHESYSAATYLARTGGQYYTARTRFTQGTPDSSHLLYRHAANGEPSPLPVTKQMLDPADTPVPMTYPGQDFARSGRRLFAFFPFTDKLVSFDAASGEADTFPLRINVPKQRMSRTSDPREIMDIINEDLEFVWKVFATPQWVVASVVHKNVSDSTRSGGLQAYTHEGDYVGEAYTSGTSPIALHDGQAIFVSQTEDPSSDYTYRLEYRAFTVE